MKILSFLLVFICFDAYTQEKPLDKSLFSEDLKIVKSFINKGNKDLLFVSRTHNGIYLPKTDSCQEEIWTRFVLLKAKNSDKYHVIKFTDCGKSETIEISESLEYFESNHSEIRNEAFRAMKIIMRTVYYSLWEFKNGELIMHRVFCRICIDERNDSKAENQNKKAYKFFVKLDSELCMHIK